MNSYIKGNNRKMKLRLNTSGISIIASSCFFCFLTVSTRYLPIQKVQNLTGIGFEEIGYKK